MELEIKHLAPYLAYGLIVKWGADTANLIGLIRESVVLNGIFWNESQKTSLKNIRPILRPLSDLTKEISHNGEKFVPIDYLNEEFVQDFAFSDKTICQVNLFNIERSNLLLEPMEVLELLFEWKFDVFGLIEKGLAIPFTSEFNPYG